MSFDLQVNGSFSRNCRPAHFNESAAV